MREIVRKISQRIANVSLAFILTLTSVTVAGPTLFASNVGASTVPDIHSVRFSTIDSSYAGIVVDAYMRNFEDATSFKVTLHRADGSNAVRNGAVDTLAHINGGGNRALTTPFNFAGSSAGVWFDALDAVWLPTQKPIGVTIDIMTDSHGLISFSTPDGQTLVENNGLYENLIPTYLPETTLVVEGAEDGLVGATFKVSGSAYSAHGLNRVYVQLVNRETSQRYGGTTINLLPEGTSANWSRTYTPADNLPEGTYAAHVEVVDRNNGRASVGWTTNFVLDKTMPEFEIITPSNNDVVRGTQRITAKITDANDITKVLMNVGDGNGNYVWEVGKTNNKVTRDGDLFYLDVDTTTLANGVNFVVLRATDGAGNTRYWNNNANTRQHSYVVDNESPVAQIIAPDFARVNTEIRGVASDNHGIRSHWFEIKAPNGLLYYKNFPSTPASEVSFMLGEIAPITEGEYVIRYVVTDIAGNRNDDPSFTNSEIHTLIIDTTRPVVVGSDELPYNPESFTITATDALSGVVTVTGNIYKYDDESGEYKLDKSNSGSDNPLTVSLSALADGAYYVRYNAKDAAGNTSVTHEFYFEVDTIAPIAPEITEVTAEGISGTAEPNSLVVIQIDGETIGVVVADENGVWEFPFEEVYGVGEHTFTVFAVDAAGNTSDATESVLTVEEDTETGSPEDEDADSEDGAGDNTDDLTPPDEFIEDQDGEVNGVQDEVDQDVAAAQDDNTNGDENENNGTVFGLAWYWWLAILAAIAAAWWLIAGALRRRNNEEA